MGVQVLSPESHHSKLRSLPKLPKTSHYSVKPLNSVKHSRALPSVPNSNLSKLDSNVKQSRALPRVPKHMDNKKASNMVARQGRTLPEVPFRDLKDNFTASSSRSSTPHLARNTSNLTQNSTSQHAVVIHNTTQQHNTNTLTHHHHHHHHKGENHHHKGENHHHKGESHHHKGENHHHNHHHQHGPQHLHVKEHQHGNTTQRTLPKLPKLSQKPKPEQNRIEYMHDVYKKEGDIFSEDGNYEQALKSYNLALKFISDEKTTIIARSRVYRKLGKLRKATQDADLALKLDPLYHEGLLQKAELLLEQGDYENALNYFQKGARMRPDKDDFHDGIEKAKHGLSENHKVARKRKNTLSPEDITQQKKSKDKSEKARKNRDNINAQSQRSNSRMSDDVHNNSYGSNASTNRESVIVEEEPPTIVPVPPPQPPPATMRAKLGRQMTPMPGRRKALAMQQQQQQPQQPTVPPTVDDVDEDMMKQILGSMYKDREYLEKFLDESEGISLPNKMNVGPTAQNGLHFLYDRVLNWVRKGDPVPTVGPTPLPRETKTSAKRKTMIHGSSVESLLEEQDKENESRKRKHYKKKAQSKAPHTWYNYLENKKVEEAQERKHARNVFLHVVEGRKIKPKEHSNLDMKRSKQDPERRSKDGKLRKNKEYDSKESLSQQFLFKSYRPGSDLRNSDESKGTAMDTSDQEKPIQTRTPPKKLRNFGGQKDRLERRRIAVGKYVAKEMEEIEMLYADGQYDACGDKAAHLLKILDTEDLPDKHVHMSSLHSYLGNVCMSKKDYERGLDHHNKDLAIGEKHKLDDAISRALGNLGRVFVVQKRHQEALDVFLRKTPMCASRIETAWLFHEIGNCFLALGDFEYAKDAAKKSLEAAEEAVEWSYQLQSCVLMGVAEVKLKQYHAAFNTFEKALDQARLQGDEKAEDAIREALQDVNDRIVEEMRTKGPMNFPESRSDNFMTPISRDNTTISEYQMQGLSRSRAEIARMHANLGYRCRADYAKTPAAQSEYSSILIPEDDGDVSLTDTVGDVNDLNLDLERLRTESTLFGSSIDLRDHIRSETFVSGKGK
ncbi:outer dynein arm-docking complex subunit 4-like [Ruditapes philippinarum]|uniref:outer dynein arm-docking complex subunit 4-like n=1 Tax=Ruditapes philippinarum TaxID=129788 RepID=UPI00295C357D|nr:outer dynein arm-docking complex subunit 4-like [Ruditapes philippinarum]